MDFSNATELDFAYAAGMVDGDGSVCVNKCGVVQRGGARSYMVTLRVSQKLDEIPLWFVSKFGGRVRKMGRGKWTVNASGREVFFPPNYAWELYCNEAADFLERIVPYLKMKKTRAEVAIKLARLQKRRGGRGFRYGGVPVTVEENAERERLALIIRAENQRGNDRVAMVSKWGVN